MNRAERDKVAERLDNDLNRLRRQVERASKWGLAPDEIEALRRECLTFKARAQKVGYFALGLGTIDNFITHPPATTPNSQSGRQVNSPATKKKPVAPAKTQTPSLSADQGEPENQVASTAGDASVRISHLEQHVDAIEITELAREVAPEGPTNDLVDDVRSDQQVEPEGPELRPQEQQQLGRDPIQAPIRISLFSRLIGRIKRWFGKNTKGV